MTSSTAFLNPVVVTICECSRSAISNRGVQQKRKHRIRESFCRQEDAAGALNATN
jgi:hypothetical protein